MLDQVSFYPVIKNKGFMNSRGFLTYIYTRMFRAALFLNRYKTKRVPYSLILSSSKTEPVG